MTYHLERKLLQTAIVIACTAPLAGGAAGMITGAGFLSYVTDVALDSHVRYLSGLLFAIGVAFLLSVPKIEKQTARVRLLTFLVIVGGLARLGGVIFEEVPSTSSLLALGMELAVTPLLCLWQWRIARNSP